MAGARIVEIRTLEKLDPEDAHRLIVGYTSPARYDVRKSETPEYTTISLQLQPLAEPYVKRWEVDPDDLARYQQIVQEGLSLGAYDGEQLVGIAVAERKAWNRSLWVWEFHVAATHRRIGLGRRLMDALADRARSAGLRILVCETQSTNMPAIQFYRRAGFEVEGVDLSYYTNTDAVDGEVAIFMKRRVSS